MRRIASRNDWLQSAAMAGRIKALNSAFGSKF
jgi:hypothetical protein